MDLARWRCCYSDKETEGRDRLKEVQFWTLASEMTGRHLSGDTKQVTGELREK